MLSLVQDERGPFAFADGFGVAFHERVGSNHDLARGGFLPQGTPVRAVHHEHAEPGQETFDLAGPVAEERGRADHEGGEPEPRGGCEEREDLDGLAEAHFVGQDEVAAAAGHAVEPGDAGLLVATELAVEDLGVDLGRLRGFVDAVVVELQAQEIGRDGPGEFGGRVRPVIRRVAGDADDLGVGIVVGAREIRDDRLERGGETAERRGDPHETFRQDRRRQEVFALHGGVGQIAPADRAVAGGQADGEFEPVGSLAPDRGPEREPRGVADQGRELGVQQEFASFALPPGDDLLDEHADGFAVLQTVDRGRAARGAFHPAREPEMHEFVLAERLLAGVAEPEDGGTGRGAEPCGVCGAQRPAVVEHHAQFERAVVQEMPVVERAELAFAHLHPGGRDDADREVFRVQQHARRLVVARLDGRPQEIAQPGDVAPGGDPPVFAEHAGPAAAPPGNDLHVLQRQRHAPFHDGGTEQVAGPEFFEQEDGGGEFGVDDDALSGAGKTCEAGQAVEEFGGELGRQRQPLVFLRLGVDREVADDLAVLLREVLEPERRGGFVEMELAQVREVACVGPRAVDQVHAQMQVLPFARGVREFVPGVELHVCRVVAEEFGEEFGQADVTQPGELGREVGQGSFLVFLDGVFRVIQRGGHGVRAEPRELAAAGARAGERAVREPPDLRVGDEPVRVAADRAEHAGLDFMAAEQTPVVEDVLGLLEDLFRAGRDQFCLETLTHGTVPGFFLEK